jgi:hypothetical protein
MYPPGSSIADSPGWFRRFVNKRGFTRTVRQALYEYVSSDNLLVVSHFMNGTVPVEAITFQVTDGSQFLSDEAVEFIGREDYVRMVACLGQSVTDDYFREKRSGLGGHGLHE